MVRAVRAAPATLTVALLALAACSTVGAPPVVPVEVVTVASADAGAPLFAARPTTPEDRRCEARVTLTGRVRTGASCQLDEQVSQNPGHLRYPCTGDGPTELEFGPHRFTGSLVGGKLSLELVTELDWDDHCHWETHQTVTGLVRGSTVRWAYSEKPVRGTGCFAACTATAELKIGNGQGPASEDDDDTDQP